MKKTIIISISFIILLIGLIIISAIPTYTKYDLKTNEIVLLHCGETIITDKDEIAEITKLINNGKEGTELVSKKYNRGLNIFREKEINGDIPDTSIKFNDNVTINLYHVTNDKYIIYGEISKKNSKYIERITLSDENKDKIRQFFENYDKRIN